MKSISAARPTALARRCLRAAGWFPGRKIDISTTVAALEREQFTVSDAAQRFLEEFGDLRLVPPFPDVSWLDRLLNFLVRWRTSKRSFDTCVRDGLRDFAKDHGHYVSLYDNFLGETLCFIGNGEFVELYISPSGRIYSGHDESLCRLGVTPMEAINRLCANAIAGLEIYNVERELPLKK